MKKLLIILIPYTSYANQNTNEITSGLSTVLLFLGLFILMYFLIIRPQTKKAKEHKNLIDSIKINDEILTNSGIIGKIIKITDHFLLLEIGDNSNIIIKKDFILNLLPKGTMKEIKK